MKKLMPALLLSLVLAACGGGGSDADPAPRNEAADLMHAQSTLRMDIDAAPADKKAALIAQYNANAAHLKALGAEKACGALDNTNGSCWEAFRVLAAPFGA